MKKIFTLLISSLFSLSMLAFDGSSLSISTLANNKNLKIEIDGRKFNMQDNSLTLNNLREGYHQVKIFKEAGKEYRNGNGNAFGRRAEIIYSNSVLLKRGFVLDIIISRYGKVFIDENRMDRNSEWYYEDDENDNDFGNGDGNGNGYGNGNNGNGWNNGYGNVMNSRDFDQLKETLRKEWFENNRITSVKTVTDKTNFTTQQVKELMLLFVFENNKLEVAKYAYRKTVDKQNYYQVNDALTFSSSKDELARFIRQNP